MIIIPIRNLRDFMDPRYLIPGLACASFLPIPVVVAADYLSIDMAQKAVYPDADSFQEVVLRQSPEQLQAILARAGPQPPHGVIRIWSASRNGVLLGHVLVDEVIGRQSLITYALGIDGSGSIRNLEIMAYRESHGGEIRNPAWRGQFARRSDLDQLRFRTDIKNISGATLSSEHVTQGVRWLLALWQAALRPSNGAV
ncbi:MAG TPA: FMN-binding protein [Steroidobacteraceae bacterium]|nr:FMN-binding protein [Steroidobacteraceae bacterium]